MSVKIYNLYGEMINVQDYKEATKYIRRNQAKWKSYNAVQLLVDEQQLKKRTATKGKFRQEVISKAHGRCYICGRGCEEHELTTDHLVSVHHGGKTEPNNIKCCCESCNVDKGSRDITEYYYHILNNRREYKHIDNKQLDRLRILTNQIKDLYPVITSKIKDNELILYVNDSESIKIRRDFKLEDIKDELYKFAKDFNSNCVILTKRREYQK